MTFSNINLLTKTLLIVVLVFLKGKIRKAFRCNIVNSEDLLKLIYPCHLIRSFQISHNFICFGEVFFWTYVKRILAFSRYTALFIVIITIDICQSN